MEINRALLAHVAHLRMGASRFVRGHRDGERRAKAVGEGIEFADYRPYQPGDDLRRVDWNTFSRLQSILIRLFHADRSLQGLICVDASASMGTGSPRKVDCAGNLAISLALIGLKERNTVRLGCFSGAGGKQNNQIVVGHNSNALSAMVRMLEETEPGTIAKTSEALRACTRGKRMDRAFLISDMMMEDDEMEDTILTLAAVSTQAILLQVLSNEDLNPDFSQNYEMVDVETRERMLFEQNPQAQDTYQRILTDWQNNIQRLCSIHNVTFLQIKSSDNVAFILADTLARMGVVR